MVLVCIPKSEGKNYQSVVFLVYYIIERYHENNYCISVVKNIQNSHLL